MKRRVVVTGLGAVTPIGNDVESFWNGVKEGKVGIGPITRFDTTGYKATLAAELKDFVAKDRMDPRTARRMEPFSQYAVAAALEAVENSGLKMEEEDPYMVGVIIGSGVGSLQATETNEKKLMEKGPSRVDPLLVPKMITNMAAGNVSIATGAKGKCTNVVTACATGTHCIGDAFRAIQYGDADVMLAGGTEGAVCPIGIAGFASLTALSTSEDPLRASIPFDKDRGGFVMGEGAGVVVLEELEHAKKRNANILAEVVGYGATADAFHITSPAEDGSGAAVVDLDFAALFEDHASREDHAAAEPLELILLGRPDERLRRKADDLLRILEIEQHKPGEVLLVPGCVRIIRGLPAEQIPVPVLVSRMEGAEPSLRRLDRRRGRTDLRVRVRNVLHAEHELRIAPVAAVRRFRRPDVEFLLIAAAVFRERPLETHEKAADLFREQHHVAVVRRRHRKDFKLVEIVGHGDSAAHAVPGVDRKAEIAATVDDRQPRIVKTDDFGAGVDDLRRNFPRFRLHVPLHAVIAVSDPEIRVHLAAVVTARGKADVVAEHHDVPAVEFADSRIEDQRGIERNIRRRQYRVGSAANQCHLSAPSLHGKYEFPGYETVSHPCDIL